MIKLPPASALVDHGLLAMILFATALAAAKAAGGIPPGYRIETIAPPAGHPLEVEALRFAPDGSLYVSTRRGDIWRVIDRAGKLRWSRFARGLQEPLGLLVGNDSRTVFVSQRSEITRIVDDDGDGSADRYLNVGDGWGYSGNYAEFTHGLVRDLDGNFFVALNLSHRGPGGVKGSTMTHNAPYRGWVAKITPSGQFVPFASGLRSPCGIGLNAAGEIFVTDNQGDWMPSSALFHIVEGRFYGHPSSLADWPEYRGRNLDDIPDTEFDRLRSPPAVWIPYAELANSPGEPVFDYTRGRFGPFAGQAFIGDQSRSNLFRAMIERVDGEYQGAVFNFAEGFHSGLIRGTFAPDGSYWAGQIDHGWPSKGGMPGGLQRVVWDGSTIPFEIHAISLTPTGFRLTFTKPLDPTAAERSSSYEIAYWHYPYQSRYYSRKLDEAKATPSLVTVAGDRMSVRIDLPLITCRVYRIRVKAVDQELEHLTNDTGWYTLNRLISSPRALPLFPTKMPSPTPGNL